MSYIVAVDQSTQGTKAILLDGDGNIRCRAYRPHAQIISERGWVSHDPMEIYENVLACVRELVAASGVDKDDIRALGISNQRETTVAWDDGGRPLQHAVVWQCARAADIAESLKGRAQEIYEATGLPLSPYFSAAKMAWLLRSLQKFDGVHLGAIDSWLLYKLTGGKRFLTDYSNASRTQLFNLHTLRWDASICDAFDIDVSLLPEVVDSNSLFGYTDFDGFLPAPIPILAVMGDSHAALYGQGCHTSGMGKVTYGSGSSVMLHVGDRFVLSRAGLATSLAWGIDGKVDYVLEGNIHYTGSVISWLIDDLQLIERPAETENLARLANEDDCTVLIPAFSGLGAPYWNSGAKAMLYGMRRTTGKREIVKAALESIAYQVADVLRAMATDCGSAPQALCVDGGPSKNEFLMQFQSDIANSTLRVAKGEERSAIGVAYLAGITAGLYDKERVFRSLAYTDYRPQMDAAVQTEKLARWQAAVETLLKR